MCRILFVSTKRVTMSIATTVRYRTILLTLVVAMFAFAAACGSSGGDEEPTNGDEGAASQQDGNSGNDSNSGTGDSNGSGTGSNNSGQSGFGDIFGLGSNSGEATCDAISAVSGIPGGALASASTNDPVTDFGKDASSFFVAVLEDALDTEVKPACIFDIEDDGDSGVWMTFSHDASVDSSTQSAIEEAVDSAGASVATGGSFFGGFAGVGFATVSISSLPFGGSDSGAVIFVSDGNIVATAGSDFDIDDDDPFEGVDIGDDNSGSSSGSSGSSGGSQAGPTPTPITFDPGLGGFFGDTGLSSDIAEAFQDALNSAFDIDLELESNVAIGVDDVVTTVVFNVATLDSTDVIDGLTEVAESFGGTVTGSFSFGGSFNVQFEGGTVAGLNVANGNITLAEGQIIVIASGTT